MKKTKLITTFMMMGFFLCAFLLCVMKQDQEYSVAERRLLNDFPSVSLKEIQTGRFMDGFEDYVLDQFPFRDTFRSLKAWVEQNLLLKKNNHEIYVTDGYAAEMVYPMDGQSIHNAAKVMNAIYDHYLKENGCKVYFSMIPDKNYYLAEKSGQLTMDYEEFMDIMQKKTSNMEYIDISGLLTINDFYRTDSHWKQENITDIAMYLNKQMGSSITGKYESIEIEDTFYGVYSGQWALPLEGDSMNLLTNQLIEQYEVYDHENNKKMEVYDMEKAVGNDKYETYLGGSLSLITIENPQINTKKELILFRDSFGSSIAPLLAEGYSKVTLVDIRYIRWERLKQFIDFKNSDVLFLYSTALLNNNEIR